MKRVALLCVFSACLAAALPPARSLAKENFTSVRSKNFFLVGNANPRDIQKVATKLEQFRDVFSRALAHRMMGTSE